LILDVFPQCICFVNGIPIEVVSTEGFLGLFPAFGHQGQLFLTGSHYRLSSFSKTGVNWKRLQGTVMARLEMWEEGAGLCLS
jgi:hypothetical protein